MVSRFSVFISFLAIASASATAFAGELEELLAKHYAARGGMEKLATVQAMQFSGSITKKSNTITFTYTVDANRCRLDYVSSGKKLIRVFDGRRGWQINPLICSEPQPLTRHETRYMQAMADELTGPLVDWKTKGHRLRYHGLKSIMGQSMYKIEVRKKHGQREVIFLDPNTYLERVIIRHAPGGPPQFIVVNEYEELNGIQFPKELLVCSDLSCCEKQGKELKHCKKTKTIRYDVRTINPLVEDTFFAVSSPHKRRMSPK